MNDKKISTQPDLETQEISPTSEKAPDGGYGWIVTTSVAIVNGHSWGINAAYSVFLAHFVEENTFPGTTPLMYAIAGSLSVGVMMLISPFTTIMARELGTRPTMLIGAIVQSVSLWFTRRRALANGIAIAGAGLGGLTYSLATGAIIRNMGLEWAYRVLAIVSAVANITCTLLIRTRYNSQATRLAFDMTLLHRPEYLLVLSYGAFSMLGYFVLIFTLANYANVIGLSSSQASMIPAFFMFGQAIGRPCIGWLSDRFGRINLTFIMSLITGILTFAIWINAKSFGVLLTFALVGGLSAGVFWVNISPVLVEVMGLENLPSALSCLWVAMAAPSTFSAPIALEIYTGTGSYLGAQLFTGFMYIAASFCVLGVRRWKIDSLRGAKERSPASGEDGQDLKPMSWDLKCLKLDIV
ncbi:major facilitator superfamily domain-containing protein [Fusarium oxysporum Fo47]|uniref:major facilitator superfamily domain-containing protein n=1 Tax=Fusarium oxysporum Fo47 TaxID=660027 RepID=UPI002869C794|nr:major facilitator superfamily domain-containing protein [Fusarium oxysporum Fo47]QKD49455.2 major facilitator superfamily domain-containing protein [Fusarium oxysporum Fo47]